MKREPRVHYTPTDNGKQYASPCGASGFGMRRTFRIANVTCRICMFQILADIAPWAREFLDDLRLPKPVSVIRPRAATKPVDGKVKGLGDGFARAFSQQPSTKEMVGEFFVLSPAGRAPVQPVVKSGGAAADAVRVQPRQVPEYPGDAGQVGHESGGDFEPTE